MGEGEKRGSIAFSATYRPPVPLDVFSCPLPPTSSKKDEVHMTDGESYNYNAREIPPGALTTIQKKLFPEGSRDDPNVESGLLFVSERGGGLETLHVALRFSDNRVKVFSLADLLPGTAASFRGVRMEDSGCFAGDHHLVYVSTKEPPKERRQPWTAVYQTNLITGITQRLTPKEYADLSPSVHPSGKKIAVASFQRKGGWDGEIEDLKTDIFVMNVEKPPLGRRLLVKDGGWPSWGGDNVIFFHRKVGKTWGVFRAEISSNGTTVMSEFRVTPDGIDAMTPAAIDSTRVAVATIRQKSEFSDVRVASQYRHIEIFDSKGRHPVQISLTISLNISPKVDHFNPFVIDGGKRIGYHRCKSEFLRNGGNIQKHSEKLESPYPDVGLFRVPGIFPTFSKDGSKLAFVDNEFKAVWVADSKGLRVVYSTKGPDNVFSPVWNQNPKMDVLYFCKGPSFNAGKTLDICAIPDVSSGGQACIELTDGFNNAFPSTNPEGTKLVFRSTRNGGDKRFKSLYIMENAASGEFGDAETEEFEEGPIRRLTYGDCVDTHCQWSPRGDWIVFSSTRDKPPGAPELDNGLDLGYFAVFLVKWDNRDVLVRVITSGSDIAGHVNHPFFSPDGMSIVVTADLAAVSVDPISLPLFVHSVRPYGDIFTFDIDSDDLNKNKDVENFHRVTHSRYENSTATWTMFSTKDPNAAWNLILDKSHIRTRDFTPSCPYVHGDGGEGWHMTGQLCIPKRCC